jgi:Ferritin-like domain
MDPYTVNVPNPLEDHVSTIDARALEALVEQSQDLQADAMRQAGQVEQDLRDVASDRAGDPVDPAAVQQFNDGRRGLLGRLGLGEGTAGRGLFAGGIGAAIAALLVTPASADTNLDTQILQTASSLEILAVATYGAALTLPFIKDGNPVIVTFATTTMDQHDQHRQAFQAQTKALGAKVQDQPNPKYAPVVESTKPTLVTPLDVVKLAATLETVATETYLSDLAMFEDAKSKEIMASVMGVESQHLATLRAVGALLEGGAPDLIAIPVDAAALPAAAGSVAFPEAFEPTTMASPPQEGAVQ